MGFSSNKIGVCLSTQDYDRLGAAFVHFIMNDDVGGALSSADLLRKLSTMKNSTAMMVSDAYDFKSWVEPHINSTLKHHRSALMWSIELNGAGHAIASFAADCSNGADIGVFGRILTSPLDARGPKIANRWHDVPATNAKKKKEWQSGIDSIQKSVAAMTEAELKHFGYIGEEGRRKAVDEWLKYKNLGLATVATISWPPAVFADIARLASPNVVGGQAEVAMTLERPRVALPPRIPQQDTATNVAPATPRTRQHPRRQHLSLARDKHC
jgi:hypothetical protein